MGDEYGGGIVAIADSVSGELVIVPDAEALETITGDTYIWTDAVSFAAAYDDGTNSDYRLMTRAEALAVLHNPSLVTLLNIPNDVDYWLVEDASVTDAWGYRFTDESGINSYPETGLYCALPIRKVNFYGLPLIDSEFGGGLVFDVVAETRTVYITPKWEDVITAGYHDVVDWVDAVNYYPASIPLDGVEFTSLPTRAQALKIFGNSYLVTLAGLPVDKGFWTSEEDQEADAWAYWNTTDLIESTSKVETLYALPVRSEVVPET